MKRKLIHFISFFGLLVILSKCSEVQPETSTKVNFDTSEKMFVPPANIEFNGEYLIFPTPESFKQALDLIRNSSSKSVIDWSSQIGFNSYRLIYERARVEQDKYLNNLLLQYQSYSSSDPRLKVKPAIVQPEFVTEYAELFTFNNDGLIEGPNLPDYDITGLINKNGLVKVAGHLFQYNKDNIKIIVGGDRNKISLLNKTLETNNKLNIVVNPIKQEKRKSTSPVGRVWNNFYRETVYGPSPVYLDVEYQYYIITESHISYYTYPTYDTTPVCEPVGCGQARTMAGDCTCYYPITGYVAYSKYEAHMETRRYWLDLLSFSYQSQSCTININYKISNGLWNHSAHNSYGLANTYLTIYDGTPAIEFTCGDEDFTALFHSGFTRTVNNSWCD